MEISSLSWVEKISVSLDSTNEQDEFWNSEELVQSVGGVVSILKELVCSVSNSFKHSSEKLTSFSICPVFVTSALASILLSKFSKSTIMETNSLSWVYVYIYIYIYIYKIWLSVVSSIDDSLAVYIIKGLFW